MNGWLFGGMIVIQLCVGFFSLWQLGKGIINVRTDRGAGDDISGASGAANEKTIRIVLWPFERNRYRKVHAVCAGQLRRWERERRLRRRIGGHAG